MQTDHANEMGSGETSVPLQLPATKVQKQIEENETIYRIDLMKAENHYLQNLHAEEKQVLNDLIQHLNNNERKKLLENEFAKLNDYVEYLRQDMISLREQNNCYKEMLPSIKKQDQEIAHYFEIFKEKMQLNKKIVSKRSKTSQELKRIQAQKESIGVDISKLENRIIEKRMKNERFNKIQEEQKLIEDKKLDKEKCVQEIKVQIKAFEDSNLEKNKSNEIETEKKKTQIESLKLQIEQRKKKAEQLEELQNILQAYEEKEKSKLNDRQRRQSEQTVQLEKENERLKILEEKFDVAEREQQDLCKSNNLTFISFKNLENTKIQAHLANFEEVVHEKEIKLAQILQDVQEGRKNQEEELQSKEETLKETKTIQEAEKNEILELKKCLSELNQKVIESRKKIDEQDLEKQEIVTRKENEFCKMGKMSNKIEELKKNIVDENRKLALVEDMYKGVLDVKKDIEEAIKNKENLMQDEAKFKQEMDTKLSAIEKRIDQKASESRDKMLAFEAQIQKNAKLLAQKKKEAKKQDSKDIRMERELREKLAKIKEEIAKFEKMEEDELMFEMKESVYSSITDKADLRSILKSPVAKRVSLDPKSPRKVTFDIESDSSSSLSEMPLTQRPRSP